MRFFPIVIFSIFAKTASANCQNLPGKVLATTNNSIKANSFQNGNAKVYVNSNGELKANLNNNQVYSNSCPCSGNSCPNQYELKLQQDGNLIVLPKNSENNDKIWKSDKTMQEGRMSLVLNNNKLQVWRKNNNNNCYTMVWSSNQNSWCRGGNINQHQQNNNQHQQNNNANCLNGIDVITTSFEQDGRSSYSNGNVRVQVNNDGNLKCMRDNNIKYQSQCTCNRRLEFLRSLGGQCQGNYGIHFQNDGQLIVKNNQGEHWKTNRRSNNQGKYALVMTNNNACEIWKFNNNNCPEFKLWSSGNNNDRKNAVCKH